jgi:hypothetical protein
LRPPPVPKAACRYQRGQPLAIAFGVGGLPAFLNGLPLRGFRCQIDQTDYGVRFEHNDCSLRIASGDGHERAFWWLVGERELFRTLG